MMSNRRCFNWSPICHFSVVTMLSTCPSLVANAPQPSASHDAPEAAALRDDLLSRVKREQRARADLIEWARERQLTIGSQEFLERAQPKMKEMEKIDTDNQVWLSKTIKRHGWPGRSLVGRDGAKAAFLLIQHASRDLALQKRCLKLMKKHPEGEVELADIALLTDRILRAEGKLQIYGSQVEFKEGRWQCEPVASPDQLDERRRAMGLPPIEEYLKIVADMYGAASPPESHPK